MPNLTSNLYAFGDFRLNAQNRVLKRGQDTVALTPKALEVLLLLIQHSGQVVSKEELMKTVWPDTFVEESNLTQTVFMLRRALRETPEQRYILTIQGRGYRFTADVRELLENGDIDAGSADSPAASPSPTPERFASLEKWQTPSPDDQGSASPAVQQNQGEPRTYRAAQFGLEESLLARRKRVALAASSTLLVVLAALIVYFRWFGSKVHASKLSEKDTIVLADLVNRSGDPVFDEALKQALSVELGQSPFLNVASDLKVGEALRRMGRSASDPLTAELAREVCLRVGGKAIMEGTISTLGSHYLVGLQALSCANGDVLAAGQSESVSKESVLRALDQVASQLRGNLGESLSSLQKYDLPVDTTTKSLEALQAFGMGLKELRDRGEGEAIPFFRHAIELDSDFALAYAALGRAYEDIGEDAEARSDFARAYNLRDRLSEREKHYVTTLYHETVTGDMERAKAAGELWTQAYPRDGVAREKLGTIYGELGELEKAYEQFQEAQRLDPDSTINVSNLVTVATALNRLDESERILHAAQARGVEGSVIHENLYDLAFLRNDPVEMERQVAWARGRANTEYVLLSAHSDTQAYFGRLRAAAELSRRAMESAKRDGDAESAALCVINAALREVESGKFSGATQSVDTAFTFSRSRDVKILGALTLAMAGDVNRARTLTEEVERENPLSTLVKFYWVPTLKASLELRAHNAQAAISLLQTAAPYERSSLSNLSLMFAVYVRGQAYLSERDGAQAAEQFEKILRQRGVVQNSILGALSLLQLARAEVLEGDIENARRRYSEFFALWKDADSDASILQEAKHEYAGL